MIKLHPRSSGMYLMILLIIQSYYSAHALEPGALNPEKPSYQLPDLPQWQPTQPEADILIDKPEQKKKVMSSLEARFILKKLDFEGNQNYTDKQLQDVVNVFVGTAISRMDLEKIRQQLLQYYRQQGFFYSSVILPDQHISQGVVRYHVSEGQLKTINIKGVDGLNEEYIRDRIKLDKDQPLKQAMLLERFQLLLSDSLIERVNGSLKSGVNPGEAILDLDVTRAKPYQLYIGMDNYTSASVGSYTGRLGGVIRNLTGWGDFLQIDLGGSEGMKSISSFFSIPFTSYDTRFNIAYQGSQSRIVEGSLESFDIKNTFMDFNLGISQPVFRRLKREFSVELQYAYRQTKASISGDPSGFGLGQGTEGNGKAKVSVIRFIQQYVERDEDQVASIRSSLNLGFDVFNATTNPNPIPDGRFFSWLGQLRYLRKLDDWGNEIYFRSDIQLVSESLLPLERFALGGVNTVRGYRQNEFVRDEGYALSVEFRFPLWQQSIKKGHELQFIPFFDYGQVWNHKKEAKTLYSAGIGLKWSWQQLEAEFYWAQALNSPDVEDQEHDAQDSGIHFKMQARLF